MTASTRVRTWRARIGDVIPATVSWTVVVATVVLLLRFPLQGAWFAAVVFAYFVVWIALHLAFYVVGLRRVRQWSARDWTAGREVPGFGGVAPADVWHVVLLPNYTEPVPVLRRALDSLAVQCDASTRLVVVLGMEEREAGSRARGEMLAREYAGAFARVLVTVHPADLPGELPCKAANNRWAAQRALEELQGMDVDPAKVTLTVCDADAVFDPRYLAAVARLFADDERRHARFWQAPVLYHGNMWEVPAPTRFTARLTQLYMLAELALPGYDPLPISTYTVSMRLAEECDWWDPAVIAEDWHSYLDYMVQRRGDVSMEPVYLPLVLDSPTGATWLSALANRYVQLRRHAWGASDVGFLTEQALSGRGGRHVAFRFAQVLHDHVLPVLGFGTAAILSLVPVLLRLPGAGAAPADVARITLAMSGLFTVSTITLLAAMAIDVVRFPPGRRRVSGVALEMVKMWALLPVAGLALGVLPALDAQTKLALGLPLEWRVTAKSAGHGGRPARGSASAPGSEL